MDCRNKTVVERLTAKYVLTLGLLGALSLANYVIVRSQIASNRSVAEVVNQSARQRVLLQQTALLAQTFASARSPEQRAKLRAELLAAVGPMEAAHHRLIRKDAEIAPPRAVREIYFDSPWLLDTEMRNYVAQVRALAEAPADELGPNNPHVKYVRDAASSRRLVQGPDAVVWAYQREAVAQANRLQGLAAWSFGSTVALLAITGWFVFRPMARRVHADMEALADLNDTLERRVAERTALAEERAEALVQSERLAAIGQMVAGVAHESRNALQQIQACCGLLEWKLNGNREARELLGDLQKAQDRLHRLFDDLRGYAAPVRLERCRRDLREVLGESWAALAHQHQERDASLRQALSVADLGCEVDPLQLEQVFRNVLENSLAACSDPVRIEVSYSKAALAGREAVQVSVRDNGPGLTDEQRERVFQPFYTTRSQGVGLGMAIAQRIVEAHGGRIGIGRSGGPGTEVLITIPRGEG